MITVVVPTANRPQMLRTALQSIASQSAAAQIDSVVVSENGGAAASATICAEFATLPIRYVYRDTPVDAKTHGAMLFAEAASRPSPHVAVLHDDDWWAPHHLGNALRYLAAKDDAVAYWSTAFMVEDEASWFGRCWNISAWMAAGFPPLKEVVSLDRRQAAIACLGSAPAHYSTLVAKTQPLADAFRRVAQTGNLLDNDRLLFLELAKYGPVLVNLTPEVFVRQHGVQERERFSSRTYRAHTGATTQAILRFCKEEEDGFEVVREYARLFERCPHPEYLPLLMTEITPGVLEELRAHDPAAVARIVKRYRSSKRLARDLCPPFVWEAARRVKAAGDRARLRSQASHSSNGRHDSRS